MIDILRMTWQNFRRKRLRSLLTVAGISVGTVLITVVSFLGTAGKTVVGRELKSMGLDGLSVSSDTDGALQEEVLDAMRNMRQITAAMPLSIQFTTAGVGGYDGKVMACGIDAGADQVISLQSRYGRMLSKGDISGGGAVCVVDEALARRAYGRDNIVGKTLFLRIQDREESFEIVGVSKAGSSVLQNVAGYMPDMVYFPYTTLQNLTGVTGFNQIAVRIADGVSPTDAKNSIQKTLRLHNDSGAVYKIENLASQREKLSGLMDIVSMVLTVISAISLLVAGINIMTVMLMSVHERTAEIGIKKAIGATAGRIMAEFMAEAVLLTLLGSLFGSAIAVVLCLIGSAVSGFPVVVSVGTLLAVMAFSVLLGVIFGVYPAKKAAELSPVMALGGGR